MSPAPALRGLSGAKYDSTDACGSGQCLLRGMKRHRETWENSPAHADFQLDLSSRQDLGSREWEWGAEVGGHGWWVEEPRWRAGHLWKRVSHPASLQPRQGHQAPLQTPPPWRALLTALLHPFLRLRRQEGDLLVPGCGSQTPAPQTLWEAQAHGGLCCFIPPSSLPHRIPLNRPHCLLASLPYSLETLWLHLCSPHCLPSCHNPTPLQLLPG